MAGKSDLENTNPGQMVCMELHRFLSDKSAKAPLPYPQLVSLILEFSKIKSLGDGENKKCKQVTTSTLKKMGIPVVTGGAASASRSQASQASQAPSSSALPENVEEETQSRRAPPPPPAASKSVFSKEAVEEIVFRLSAEFSFALEAQKKELLKPTQELPAQVKNLEACLKQKATSPQGTSSPHHSPLHHSNSPLHSQSHSSTPSHHRQLPSPSQMSHSPKTTQVQTTPETPIDNTIPIASPPIVTTIPRPQSTPTATNAPSDSHHPSSPQLLKSQLLQRPLSLTPLLAIAITLPDLPPPQLQHLHQALSLIHLLAIIILSQPQCLVLHSLLSLQPLTQSLPLLNVMTKRGRRILMLPWLLKRLRKLSEE